MRIICQHMRDGFAYGDREVFEDAAEVREELSGDLVLPQYKRELFAWLDSDSKGSILLDLSLAGSGVSSVDMWSYETCSHTWVGGMCYVHEDDAEAVNAERLSKSLTPLECENCGESYK